MGATRHIYGLYDPRDGVLRYVGCAVDTTRRLQNHLRHPHSKRLKVWLQELAAVEMIPRVEVFETVAGYWDATAAEARRIHENWWRGTLLNERNPLRERRDWEQQSRNKWARKNRHYLAYKLMHESFRMLTGRLPTHQTPPGSDYRGWQSKTYAFGSEELTCSQWAKRCGISRQRMHQRLAKYEPAKAIGKYLAVPTPIESERLLNS